MNRRADKPRPYRKLDKIGQDKSAVTEGTEETDDSAERHAIVNASPDVRMLVEAGPGTGKTEMAALRIASLVRHDLSPGEILVLSFSRSAVHTLTRRIGRISQTEGHVLEDLRHLSIRTFDSWSFRMLRRLGHSPAQLLSRRYDENIAELTKIAKGSHRQRLLDAIGGRKHLIVDEFQDLPGVRGDLVMALLELLAPPGKPGLGFTILGDPAQAIYGFAAGEREDGGVYPTPLQYWNQIAAHYARELQIRVLRYNYRAHSSLAQLATDLRVILLSERPDEQKQKAILDTIASLPEPSRQLSPEFLDELPSGSQAILTRTNGEALQVLRKLFGQEVTGPAVPVRLRAGSYGILPAPWIAGLLRKLRSPQLPRSQFSRIHSHLIKLWGPELSQRLGLPPEKGAWERLALASGVPGDTDAISVPELRSRLAWPDAFPDDQAPHDEGLVITTIHQSKGMEFDVVTLLDAASEDEEEAEDGGAGAEASVGYVGITRAGRELKRIPASQIYEAPNYREFRSGCRRLFRWYGGWVNIEIGLRGDIDPLGFADPASLNGPQGVEELQALLLKETARLEGHKVMLLKHWHHDRVIWKIHLQDGNKAGRLLGRTTNQLTRDLLDILHPKYKLPSAIFNLRISSIGTVCAEDDFPLEEPDRTSRLWLGIGLFGMGDFKPQRSGNS